MNSLLHFKTCRLIAKKITSSINLLPRLDLLEETVEKKPQLISIPRIKLIPKAIIKITNKIEAKSATDSRAIPKIRKTPVKNSTQGKIIAKRLIKKDRKST